MLAAILSGIVWAIAALLAALASPMVLPLWILHIQSQNSQAAKL